MPHKLPLWRFRKKGQDLSLAPCERVFTAGTEIPNHFTPLTSHRWRLRSKNTQQQPDPCRPTPCSLPRKVWEQKHPNCPCIGHLHVAFLPHSSSPMFFSSKLVGVHHDVLYEPISPQNVHTVSHRGYGKICSVQRIRAAFVILGTLSTKDYHYPCVVQDQFKIISLRALHGNPLPVTLLTCFLFWESTGLKGQSQKRPHLYRVCFHPHKGSQTMPVPAGGLLNGMRTKGFLCLLFIH